MAKFETKTCREALEESIKTARLPKRLSATVAAARVLADRIDEIAPMGFVDKSGKLDNVSVPTYLRYLSALGLTAEPKPKKPGPKPKGADQLAGFMSDHGIG
jgi:hypothetical protein